MAGIGFELKKIFKERSLVSLLKGAVYSTFTVIGPMLIIMLSFMALYLIMGYQSIDYGQRDLLVSIILYIFVFSLILTSPLAAVLSRHIADKIFEEKTEDVMPGYYAGLLLNAAIGTLFSAPFAIVTGIRSNISPIILLMAYCMFMALLFVFFNMTYITALKEYKSIVLSFFVGMLLALGLSILLYKVLNMSFIMSVLIGMSIGFLFIGLLLFALVKKFFIVSSKNYKEFLQYLWRHKLFFFTNLFYILGLYIHNFIYWNFSEYKIIVAGTMRSAPVYDTATFLAMMTSVSVTVIFTVRVEINFHDRYQVYCQQLIGGIGRDILLSKQNMFQTLVKELSYIVQIQTIISVLIFLIISVFSSFLGLGGLVMTIYPALAAAYFIVFIMYCMIVFLYYFDDGFGALISSLAFFIATGLAAAFSLTLDPTFSGLGLFAGAFTGWTVSFFRLKFIEKNLDRQVFSRGQLVKKVSYKTLPLGNYVSAEDVRKQNGQGKTGKKQHTGTKTYKRPQAKK